MFKNFFVRMSPEGAETAGGSSSDATPSFDAGVLADLGLSASDIGGDQPLDAESNENAASVDDSNLTPEQITEKLLNEKPDTKTDQPLNEESKFLESLNALGFQREGNPFKVESPAQLKELVQKGMDYTANTQKFAAEKQDTFKLLDQQITKFEQEKVQYQDFHQNAEKFDYALQRMEQTNPDLYAEVMNFTNGVQSEVENPYIKGLASQVEQLKQQLGKQTESFENKSINNEWKTEYETFIPSIQKTADALGIKIDPEKVKAEWSKSDKTDVKSAFYAVYGAEIQKKFASRTVLENAKRKNAAEKSSKGIGGANRSSGGKEAPDLNKMNDLDRVMAIANSMGK